MNAPVYNVIKKQSVDVNVNEIIETYFEEDSNTTTDTYRKLKKSKKKKEKDISGKKQKKTQFKEVPILKINPVSQKIIEGYDKIIQPKNSEEK